MRELKLDADHVVTEEDVAEMTGVSTAQIRNTHFLHHMGFADGSLAIRTHIYFKTKVTADDGDSTFQLEFADGGFRSLNLSSHAKSRLRATWAENHWASIPFGNDVLYLQKTSHAFLVSRGDELAIGDVQIEKGIGDAKINENLSLPLAVSPKAHPVSDGYLAAIPAF